jgi:hypothetical protein
MLYSETIADCSQIHTKHINTLCGQNVQYLSVCRNTWPFLLLLFNLPKISVGLFKLRPQYFKVLPQSLSYALSISLNAKTGDIRLGICEWGSKWDPANVGWVCYRSSNPFTGLCLWDRRCVGLLNLPQTVRVSGTAPAVLSLLRSASNCSKFGLLAGNVQ